MAVKLSLVLALCIFAAAVSAGVLRNEVTLTPPSTPPPWAFPTTSSPPTPSTPSSPAPLPTSSPAPEGSTWSSTWSSPEKTTLTTSSPAPEATSTLSSTWTTDLSPEPTTISTAAPKDISTSSPSEAPITRGPTDTPYTKPTEIPDVIPRSCAERPDVNDYLMIPDPSTCTNFIVCKGAESWTMACPGGTFFNYHQQYCDWPWNVDSVDCVEPDE